jgi:hypothetical protein
MEAGECNVHHVTLGDSNSKVRTPSIDTRMRDVTMKPVEHGKSGYHQWLREFSGAYVNDERTFVLICSWA